ncbi:MAG TPA: YihY/virulence factor BrkB family protein [Jiangellales bacterium]|nr:YihY/virulence factor BrkB family protein [Jiangellales bacterium]
MLARLRSSRAARAWTRFSDRRGNRLAGAVTFYGFVSLVPVLMLAVATASWALGDEGVAELQELVEDNLPGIELDLSQVQSAAATLTVIAIPTLLWTGLGWVDALRASVRSMWDLDDRPGSMVQRKGLDALALIGLGLVVPLSMALSAAVSFAHDLLETVGVGGLAGVVASAGGILVTTAVSAVLFGYLLSGMPRIPIVWRVLVPSALIGGVAFEILKIVVARFVGGPGTSNVIAAFAVPLAVLAWIYLVIRLLMYLAAYTAEWVGDATGVPVGLRGPLAAVEAPVQGPATPPLAGGTRPVLAMTPDARQARTVGLAAGTAAGAAGAGALLLVRRGVRVVAGALRR